MRKRAFWVTRLVPTSRRTVGNLYGSHQGGFDAFIAKYDSAGNVLWGRQFGTSALDDAWRVATDSFDNAYLVGRTQGNLAGGHGYYDAFIRKYAATGAVAWTRQIGTSGYDEIRDMAVDSSGSVYVMEALSSDAHLAKYDANGTLLWTRYVGGCFGAVAVDNNGDVYAAGITGQSTGGSVVCLTKLNANGRFYWLRTTPYNDPPYYGSPKLAVSGNHIYVVRPRLFRPPYYTQTFVAYYSGDGTLQWEHFYAGLNSGGSDTVNSASASATGDLFVSGYSFNDFNPSYNGFVMKISPNGNWPWYRFITAPPGTYAFAVLARTVKGGVIGRGIVIPPSPFDVTEVYAAGYTLGDLGIGQQGNGDAFLRRLDDAGNTVWTR